MIFFSKYKISLFLSLVLFLFPIVSYSQPLQGEVPFMGGDGGGSTNDKIENSQCFYSNSGDDNLYSGGIAGGSSFAHELNSNCYSLSIADNPYSGSIAGGSSFAHELNSNCYSLSIADNPYSGSIAGGSSFAHELNSNCYSLSISDNPYSGSIAGGSSFAHELNSNCYFLSISDNPYSGSIAGGSSFASRMNVDPLTCAPLSPLPIELLYFNATRENDKVRTEWITLSERNNDYFTVERSIDGFNWLDVGYVKGAGNSSSQLDYYLYDKKPEKGLSYYRLKQTDFDGKYTYSTISSVIFTNDVNDFILVYPNPSEKTINISLNEKEFNGAVIRLYDISGKLISVLNDFTGNFYTLDISSYQKGIYIMEVEHKTEKSVFKIIKQ